MTLTTGDILIFAGLIVLAAAIICVKLYTKKRMKNIDGFGGLLSPGDKNVVASLGEKHK